MGSLVHFATARNYVRSRVTAEFMNYECRVERVAYSSYDETTLHSVSATREIIYEGPCRLWEVPGAATVLVGESDLQVESTQLSLPWDINPVPKRNDEVIITGSAEEEDSTILGKRFQIQTSAKAGELRPSRRYTVSAVQR
jgi:Family of unknown function (DUF6093)